jgi:hypothetical protein
MNRLKAKNPKFIPSDDVSSLDNESFNNDVEVFFDGAQDSQLGAVEISNVENTQASTNRAVRETTASKTPRKSGFSTIESNTLPKPPSTGTSNATSNARFKQLQYEKEGLSTSLKSAHKQNEGLREAMGKLRRQKAKEIKVLNGTITCVRKVSQRNLLSPPSHSLPPNLIHPSPHPRNGTASKQRTSRFPKNSDS